MPKFEEIKDQAELDAIIKEATDKAVQSALSRSNKKSVSKDDYSKLEKELLETQEELKEIKILPQITAKYMELGGKEDALQDYLKKHKETLYEADPKRFEKLIKDTIKETSWAFEEVKPVSELDTPDFDSGDEVEGSLFSG